MGSFFIPVWKEAPFIRLVIPFAAGITAGDICNIPPLIPWVTLCISIAGVIYFSRVSLRILYRTAYVQGILIQCMFVSLGAVFIHYNDTAANARLVERAADGRSYFIVTLKEPVSNRAKSFRALASIRSIHNDTTAIDPQTDILLYFRKDSTASPPGYGNRIAFTRPPQRIRNFAAAGTFDYVRYCAQRNIHFQVFLNTDDYVVLNQTDKRWLSEWLFGVQRWVIAVLQQFITGKKEYGLAAALLIGYKDDLDKQLMQSYSNTGVVHVVAISGLHLGLIYGLLKYLCIPLYKTKATRWAGAMITIAGLWMFSLLAGASPSVVRSAVMFTCIVGGEMLNRKSSVFNNLAASAMLLLCYQPYWLWDIGFQLSYAALVSIVVFMKPVYQLVDVKNRMLEAAWKLNAVTIAAQILTAPLCMYYFHQFPVLFLVSNFIAVPLSSVILMGEIALCMVSSLPFVAGPLGCVLEWLLKVMNMSVSELGRLPFSSFTGLRLLVSQVILMYTVIGCLALWLMLERRWALSAALVAGILFMAVRLI